MRATARRGSSLGVIAATALLAAAPAGSAAAQSYPVRPITLVVPFPAGGPLDTGARVMAERMLARAADLGQEIFPRDLQTPDALAAFHKAEVAKWWPVIKAANIKVE